MIQLIVHRGSKVTESGNWATAYIIPKPGEQMSMYRPFACLDSASPLQAYDSWDAYGWDANW